MNAKGVKHDDGRATVSYHNVFVGVGMVDGAEVWVEGQELKFETAKSSNNNSTITRIYS